MRQLISLLRKTTPKWAFKVYHLLLAYIAAWRYGHPSRKLVVVGVTGTNGKSSTIIFLAKILQEAGYKVGYATTVGFQIGEKSWLNKHKMTMLGRFTLQKMLAQMVSSQCQVAIVEVSSEGLAQNRHVGIDFDLALFTNLTPEHIESHNSFERYKLAKGRLFASLSHSYRKKLDNIEIKKQIVVNTDDIHAPYYAGFSADSVVGVGSKEHVMLGLDRIAYSYELKEELDGLSFKLDKTLFKTTLLGGFNISNLALAVATAEAMGVSLNVASEAVSKLETVPGRMEWVSVGQDFKVLVDYAPEPFSLQACYSSLQKLRGQGEIKRVIHVLGSCGGGRDVARRPILGRMAGQFADMVIVTNEDPYDEDPEQIIDQVLGGVLQSGKVLDKDVFKEVDRKKAINKAFSLARAGDLVLLTGKGAEQAIVVADGYKMPWDERRVAEELLKSRAEV